MRVFVFHPRARVSRLLSVAFERTAAVLKALEKICSITPGSGGA
jgi:hypothetical protein